MGIRFGEAQSVTLNSSKETYLVNGLAAPIALLLDDKRWRLVQGRCRSSRHGHPLVGFGDASFQDILISIVFLERGGPGVGSR